MSKPTVEEIQQAEDQLAGWCTTCNEFVNHGDTEADAEDYECGKCGASTVQGVGTALMDGLFED